MRIYLLLIAGLLSAGCSSPMARQATRKMTLVVLDADTKQPITDAFVYTKDLENPREKKIVHAKTNGKIVIEEQGLAVSWGKRVNAKGYYSSKANLKIKGYSPLTRRARPWNPKIVVWMRKVRSPLETVLAYENITFVVRDIPMGYDLVMKDWVYPYGKGEKSDFIFTFPERLTDDPRRWCLITFSNPLDGIQQYTPDPKQRQSSFKFPYDAPLTGYTNKVSKYKTWGINPEVSNSSNTNCYMFRVRSREGEHGQVTGLHGSILNGLNVSIGTGSDFRFHYRINTNSFSRSLEYKERQRP